MPGYGMIEATKGTTYEACGKPDGRKPEGLSNGVTERDPEVRRMTIRELRATKGLSQARFAKLIGVTPGTVGHLENGRMKVSAKIADKIWEVFGVEVAEAEEKKQAKKKAQKPVIYVQSPLGGNITPEEIAAKMPEGAEAVFVRVDQNKLWWIRGEETGSVEIWE